MQVWALTLAGELAGHDRAVFERASASSASRRAPSALARLARQHLEDEMPAAGE